MNPIAAAVARRGRVNFAEFMELALYHPKAGYYTKARRGHGPAGAEGDFLTAPTAAPLFARTLAKLLTGLAEAVETPCTLVELGAGEGIMLERLREALGADYGRVIGRVVAVEAAAWARERLEERWPGAETAARLADVRRPAGPTVFFASELYDAVPVHRVTMRKDGARVALAEFYVEASAHDHLQWALAEPSTPGLAAYLGEHGIVLDEGQLAELRPDLRRMHAENLAWCGHDTVAIVIDYGHPSRQLYNPRGRRFGSLIGYRAHELVDDVLQDPGEIDLTAHVNFDDLFGAGADLGWERQELRALGWFLALHGALDLLPPGVRSGAALSSGDWAELAAAKRLLTPTGMGADLKVLTQGKGRVWQAYLKLATPPPEEA